METKEIIIPQGWEIDEVEDNKIIIKEIKKELPKTWEECIAKILEENQIPFQREYSFCDLVYKSPLKFDFAIFSKNGVLSHLIEFDGKQHFEINNFFGGEEEFQKNKIRDELKNNYCIENKIPLIRIKYDEEINLERIMDYGTYECSTERT